MPDQGRIWGGLAPVSPLEAEKIVLIFNVKIFLLNFGHF